MKLILLFILSIFSCARAEEAIRIVGSSTIYPFITVAAEHFGLNGHKTPIVEATGSGGGFKLLCGTNSRNSPDINNASRKMKQSEIDLCHALGIRDIQEVTIGYDGIIIANNKIGPDFNLTTKQLFLGLAKLVPQNGKLVDNFYQSWSDIDPSLPDIGIEFYGPPFSSGTRESFIELVMITSCKSFPEYLNNPNLCSQLRNDGKYIEASDNDNVIIQKLSVNESALGLVGFNYYEHSRSIIKAATINNIAPNFSSIQQLFYPLSRPLYLYINNNKNNPQIKNFIKELQSPDSVGKDGYMTLQGLIPAK